MRLYAALVSLAIMAPRASAEPPTQLRAQTPAKLPAPPSLTLRGGVVSATLTLELNAAKGDVLAPASVAPDLSVGVTDWLTLSAITSGSALSGFRGSAGWGLCMTGSDDKCPTRYTAGGIESLVGLSRGSVALAANVGVLWTTIEPTLHTDLKVGFRLRLSEGNVFALFSPNVWIALDDRFDRLVPHEHQVMLPISVWAKPTPKLAIGVGTGVKGPAERFAERMAVPIGALFQLAMSPRVSVGSSFVFGKMLGGSAVMDPGIDARAVQLWLSLTSG